MKAEAEATDGPRIGAHVAFATPTTDCRSSSVTCEPASGGFFPVGTTIVTCRADAGGELRGVGGFPVTVDSVRTFCAASDDNGDWFTEVIDRSSPLAGFWAYRVAESGKAYFGMAQRIKYRSGRSFVSSDSSSPRASMRVNFQLGPDGGGMIRITDRATGKRFILSDSRISDDPLCE